MKRITGMLTIGIMVLIISTANVNAKTINEADTTLCDTLNYALMSSLREPVDKAIVEIYKNDINAPQGLRWDTTGAKILKIKQLYGVGGLYEITLRIKPFYRAHITYGVDEVVVNSNGELIRYKHLKTYPL
ncbi:DUF3888 domain-containing protein [Priestia megaterium]|uniref:DUF3888 domain-containing protein n=1 Tax=Priestia megaterium (strain ATCC 14581 / DSM 32 / CCUG 1817 / JCM 2506 / NBRC 15308 / NCIMB 9376 / NCTC 10342 / NRRL B-14308 / VKM B-512 / Ford 19) TaxID=1348623 RepID=A0A0B6AKW2_PRIM2|nr:DUF3888 domain-containing protein [Priestia megaterium]AJI25520.1 hypothetical protein BG04_5306 [Priestia megaterium NBRC 15308 = ATCC 14581]KFN05551.1 hypothetical protein DJ91_3980 [Priestia megaterium]KGJ78666.1 hypothetical protein BMT_21120 [Priestia megaterium NBRC 15308 = ATCC 14581]MDR4233981.1 DUF3888 domain-containing protein [Priestia megaterium]MED3806650.1 DUF3888 domain-containing protein [Priestia megaterium]